MKEMFMNQVRRKGIILAGGKGTRLYPTTKAISKQLINVYDKPMIYYALTTLMLAGIREIAVVVHSKHLLNYKALLEDGSQFGVDISYFIQDEPNGLAEAYLICKDFIDGDPSCLILGDNFFYGSGLTGLLRSLCYSNANSILLKQVAQTDQFGIASIDQAGEVIKIIEKPVSTASNLAVVGIYFLDGKAPEFASRLKPSARGELEIVDLLNVYLSRDNGLMAKVMPRGMSWFDMGTVNDLHAVSQFVATVQNLQNIMIGCPTEVCESQGWL